MNISIKVFKGPVDEDAVRAISRLYGKFDSRFSDFEYCRIKFNENPFGYSYHSFAYDDDIVVGHCSVIPIKIVKGMKEIKSGKSEAMVLAEKYRKLTVADGESNLPILMKMIIKLYDLAIEDGVDPIHAISLNPGVCMINRLCGFKKLPLTSRIFFNVISHKEMEKSAETALQKTVIKIIFVFGNLLYELNNAVNSLSLFSDKSFSIDKKSPKKLSFRKVYTEKQWGILLDESTTSWFFRTGRLLNVAFRNNEDSVILWESTKPENSLWVVAWKISNPRLYSKVFIRIINYAKKRNKSCVVFPEFSIPCGKKQRKTVISNFIRFFFPWMEMNFDIYVKSKNPEYFSDKNIDFNAFFLSL